MATVDSILFKFMKGMIGKELVIKQYKDKTVVSKRANMSNRVLSEKQKEANLMMIAANSYAKQHYYDPALKKAAKERLELLPGKSLFHALVREGMDEEKRMKEENGKK